MKELFILSVQRSGSNWLHRCLDNHDMIHVNGELHISEALLAVDSVVAGDHVAQKRLEDADIFRSAGAAYARELMIANVDNWEEGSNHILADKSAYPCIMSLKKSPEQLNYAKIIDDYFPDAKKILLVRDVKDVIVSFSEWKGQHMGSLLHVSPSSLYLFTKHLNNWCQLHEQWMKDASADSGWMVMKYADMKLDFKSILRKVYSHLEIEVDDTFMEHLEQNYYRIDSPVYAEENKNRGYGFFRTGGMGEWKKKFSWPHKLIYALFFSRRVSQVLDCVQRHE